MRATCLNEGGKKEEGRRERRDNSGFTQTPLPWSLAADLNIPRTPIPSRRDAGSLFL